MVQIRFCFDYSSIAQLVERMTVNHDVAGSSPAGGVHDMVSYVSQYTILIVRVCGHSLSCCNRSNLTTTYLLSPVYKMSDISPLEGCMGDYWCKGTIHT